MNEEEIKGKLLLPFLNDLGFESSEISFEKSFAIRLGKSQHTVKGRADILCKRNGRNLFIIELKSDSIAISQEDIDQGISYSRLLEQIAPFTIISNWKTTKIFDSISRNELTGTKISDQSSFWRNGYILSTDEELRIRYEALKNFVSFSSENLKLFCKKQVQDRMGPIIGNIDNPNSKFVKELYIQRQNLLFSFKNFLDSKSTFFSIVGNAGVGKTNTICSLAIQCLEDMFVFFYNASIINKSPLDHIAQDLNVVFSSKSESDIVLKKLDELGRSVNKNVIIFIDAIDEYVNTNIALELSEIALAVRHLEKVKFCISCKSNIWKDILKINGTSTHLFEELSKFHDPIDRLDKCPGFLLEEFSSEEIKDLIPLYQSIFGFKGQISSGLLNELKNGFFLRIFSEVYSHRQIPEKIDDKELIKKYINQSLEKTNIGVQANLRILSRIGQILMSYKYSARDAFVDEGIDVNNVLEKLKFSLDEKLPEDLFARNILIKSNKEDSYKISFYYSKIRDYIICFHSYKLDKLDDNEFYNVLHKFYQNYIGQSAIDFYLVNATDSHNRTLIKFKKDKALEYVAGYNTYLETNFKNFKNLFDPHTNGDIGIILAKDILNRDGYALFPLDSNSSKIQYENLDNPFSNPYEDRLIQKGVSVVYGSNKSLMVSDQSSVIRRNVFKQLKEIIKKGSLNEYSSEILLMEKVITILYYYYEKLGYDFNIKDFYLPRFELIYPIDLKNLRERVYKFRASYYYKEQKVNPTSIDHLIEDAIEKNLEIPKLNIVGDFPPFEELYEIVNILLRKGSNKIEKHYLPCPDKSLTDSRAFYNQNKGQDLRHVRCAQYSEEQARLYTEIFFKHLDSCYKEFVECCFPMFMHDFPFYTTLPHEYFFYINDSGAFMWGMFGYRSSLSKESKVHFKDFESRNEAFKKDQISVLRGFSFDRILHNDYYNAFKTIDRINTPKVDEYCVLRNWIYQLLNEDLKVLFEENDI